MEKREGYAPWSLTRKAGVQSATVNGDIEVPQFIQPVLSTGFVDYKGNWKGTVSSDETFFISDKAEGIANGGDVLFPNTSNQPTVDMLEFTTFQFALKVTSAGNYSATAVYGPDTVPFANLSPIAPAEKIKIVDNITTADEVILDDTIVVSYVNTWFIVTILADRTKGQKNMQIKITNNSGSASNIDFGFRRLV